MATNSTESAIAANTGALVVAASAVLGWVLMVTVTDGWGEPVIVFWSFLVMLGLGLTLYAVKLFDLPSAT